MTPPEIPINRTGRIVHGDEVGRFVRVEPDELGHFLIITSPNRDVVHGDEGVYDGWVEDEPSLNQYFAEAGWIVEWLE